MVESIQQMLNLENRVHIIRRNSVESIVKVYRIVVVLVLYFDPFIACTSIYLFRFTGLIFRFSFFDPCLDYE